MTRINRLSVTSDAVDVANPLLDPRTYAALAVTVLLVRRDIPALTVTITPNTNGRAWLVDHCCSRVWLSARLRSADMLRNLDDAVNTLRLRQRTAVALDWMPQQRHARDDHDLAAGR